MLSEYRTNWTPAAKCAGSEDILFADGPDQRKVRLFCRDCPVQRECLAEALDARMEWGVWGGMTERDRRALLRQRPDVTSWRELLFESPKPAAPSARSGSARGQAPASDR